MKYNYSLHQILEFNVKVMSELNINEFQSEKVPKRLSIETVLQVCHRIFITQVPPVKTFLSYTGKFGL
jgi:hypothetical protein